MIVMLKGQTAEYPDLTFGQLYGVLSIEADDYRILHDQGRPYLYPPALFEIVDTREPADWVNEFGEDRERYAYPPQIPLVGFFEDFFDDQREAVATFWQVVNQHLALVAK
jgi:hypothetical protein